MSELPALRREDLVVMLAELDGRPVADVRERIGSMELAWLVHRVEQRYATRLDLDDDQLAAMATVADAVRVFRQALPSVGDG
ncbi:MAG: acyl carrier protein [Micromonosporaceae bacterium]